MTARLSQIFEGTRVATDPSDPFSRRGQLALPAASTCRAHKGAVYLGPRLTDSNLTGEEKRVPF